MYSHALLSRIRGLFGLFLELEARISLHSILDHLTLLAVLIYALHISTFLGGTWLTLAHGCPYMLPVQLCHIGFLHVY
jgi:hypothetical protein